MNPFLRNLGIIAIVAVAIVVLNAETALTTAAILLRVVFFIVIAVVVYFFWRDVARHEISTWGDRNTRVFYAAVVLLIVDAGWWIWSSPQGRDALVAIVVAVICGYVGFRIWREQKRYG
jgi:amino acid transporter